MYFKTKEINDKEYTYFATEGLRRCVTRIGSLN